MGGPLDQERRKIIGLSRWELAQVSLFKIVAILSFAIRHFWQILSLVFPLPC
jgi:hypothetical protein